MEDMEDLPKSLPKSRKFSDDNKSWLKKADGKTMSDEDDDSIEDNEDDESDESEEVGSN